MGLLAQLADRREAIEADDDWTSRRQVVELLVSEIQVTMWGTGRRNEADVVTYSFSDRQAVDATMSSRARSRDKD